MFLSTALKEKLKRDFLDANLENQDGVKFSYKPKSPDKRMLINFHETLKSEAKDPTPFIRLNSQQLKALDKKEWESTFTLKNLHSRWKGTTSLNFDSNFKKFTNDIMTPSVKAAKKYVINLTEPDILEKKQKYFDLSTDVNKKIRPELKKTVFEISKGLKNFQIVPLKEHKVNEGVDTRDHLVIDNNEWNSSNLIDKHEFKEKFLEDSNLAQENTFNYWKENEDNRNMENPLPIREERQKVESVRYYHKYKSPFQKSIDYYLTMSKIKEDSALEKDEVEKKILTRKPYLAKCPEKLNALILKSMNSIYKNKYNKLKISRSVDSNTNDEIKPNDNVKTFKWNDNDLVNKIIAVNKIEESGLTTSNNMNFSPKSSNYDYLLPLVPEGKKIDNEEEKIEEKLREENLKQKKRELLLQQKKFHSVKRKHKFTSKYPLNKIDYELTKKTLDDSNQMDLYKEMENNPNIEREIMNKLSKTSGCGPHFLEAYCKIANEKLEQLKENDKKMKEKNTIKYTHPGKYRPFIFIEKVLQPKPPKTKQELEMDAMLGNPPEPERYVEKRVTEHYWSCCMNTDKDSPGCQKIIERNFKYLYN